MSGGVTCSTHGPLCLVTGATGLVGGTLVKLLNASGPRRFALLSRQPDKLEEFSQAAGFSVLRGDITRPYFGLNHQIYAELARQITAIIHCAADTRFGIPLQRAREVNTAGTQTALNFASHCRRLEKFAYVSTLYVVGQSSGCFAEARIRHQNGFCNGYQQSKYEAEELVFQAMGNIPAAIFRLSSLIGDSLTGRVRQFNYVHKLIRLLPENVLPVVPGRPDAPIDLIASDWATAALAYLFESAFKPGRFYHICAGPEHSLTLREIIDLTISVYESHPAGRTSIRVPELVSLSCYQEFVKKGQQQGDRLFNELVKVLGYFLPHLAIFQAFENRDTTCALRPSGLEFPSLRACLESAVNFCLDTNWGKSDMWPT